MAKAKVLEDKVVISSEVLTDEILDRVAILNPSVLNYKDEEGNVLYQVAQCECNSFTRNGASFKGGKTTALITVSTEDEESRKKVISDIVTRDILKINAIEEQVKEYLEDAEDITVDIDFI